MNYALDNFFSLCASAVGGTVSGFLLSLFSIYIVAIIVLLLVDPLMD